MRARKKDNEEHVDNHRWVVSYADFITLLFAFFVVMYAISSLNDAKYKSLSEGMHSAFNNKEKGPSKSSSDGKDDGIKKSSTKGKFDDGMEDLNKSLSEFNDENYQLQRQDGWIEMNIQAGALFEAGNASLKPDALLKLMKVAQKIKDLPYPVAIEGYTDDVPIATPEYPSNWELSAARAAVVGRILNNYGIDSNRITVTGYADQFPIVDNITDEGRRQNRRVNILITKNKHVKRLFNPQMGLNGLGINNAAQTNQSTKHDKKDHP